MGLLFILFYSLSDISLTWALLQGRGIPFDEILVPFVQTTQPSPFKVFSPTAKVPDQIRALRLVFPL